MPQPPDMSQREIYGARLHFLADGSVAISMWKEPQRGRGAPRNLLGPRERFVATSDLHDALEQALYAVDKALRGRYARLLRERDLAAAYARSRRADARP